jgi:hypothetical protein
LDQHINIPITGTISSNYLGGYAMAPDGSYVPGDVFDLTPDGRFIVYLAWGVRPLPPPTPTSLATPGTPQEGNYGTLFTVDVTNPDHQFALGSCSFQRLPVSADDSFGVDCLGFRLTADGRQVAYADGLGVWVAQVPEGKAQLLASHHATGSATEFYFTIPLAWSPDGQWLTVSVRPYEGAALFLINAHTGQTQRLPRAACWVICPFLAAWASDQIWVASGNIDDTDQSVVLYSAQPSQSDVVSVTRWITATEFEAILPTALLPLADGRLLFALQTCADRTGPPPGIYALELDGRIQAVAPLPALPCPSPYSMSDYLAGSVSWNPDGSSFIYMDETGRPILLGLENGPTLWDVRQLLAGAKQFSWAAVGQP